MDQAAREKRGLGSFAPALVLLVFAVLINYVDRGNLSLAAPLLKDEWHLSASQLGILLSSFFWTYTLLQFVVGRLVDRFEVNTVLAVGFTLWSLATAATGLITGFALLLAMRLLLGVGESVVFPSCSKILAQHVHEGSRGFANGVLCAAMRWGSAAGTFGGGLLIAKYGWRPTFIGIGLVSLLWLPAWWKWKPRREGAAGGSSMALTPKVAAILRQRSFWAASAGHFSGNYLLYFMITWLPFYLVRERHLSMVVMAKTAGLYYLVDAASSLVTGYISDSWIRSGATPNLARKSAMAVGFSIAAIALGCCAVAGPHTYFWCLMAVGVGSGTGNTGAFAFAQTLAGPRAAGSWVGLQNGFANFAGVICPALTGFLVDWSGHFSLPLAIAATVSVAGGLSWIFGIVRLEPLDWTERPVPPTAAAVDLA
jgi:MFS transporter, ACS family, D-galactonate transporter